MMCRSSPAGRWADRRRPRQYRGLAPDRTKGTRDTPPVPRCALNPGHRPGRLIAVRRAFCLPMARPEVPCALAGTGQVRDEGQFGCAVVHLIARPDPTVRRMRPSVASTAASGPSSICRNRSSRQISAPSPRPAHCNGSHPSGCRAAPPCHRQWGPRRR